MEIFRVFTFEAAHQLPRVPSGHKCGRLHGHSYRVEVHVRGVPDERGWVMDFGELKRRCASTFEMLDHRYLNDIPGLDNPTSEVLAAWLADRLRDTVSGLCRIVVQETCTSGVRYEVTPS